MGDSCQMSVSLLYVFVTGQRGGGGGVLYHCCRCVSVCEKLIHGVSCL